MLFDTLQKDVDHLKRRSCFRSDSIARSSSSESEDSDRDHRRHAQSSRQPKAYHRWSRRAAGVDGVRDHLGGLGEDAPDTGGGAASGCSRSPSLRSKGKTPAPLNLQQKLGGKNGPQSIVSGQAEPVRE